MEICVFYQDDSGLNLNVTIPQYNVASVIKF